MQLNNTTKGLTPNFKRKAAAIPFLFMLLVFCLSYPVKAEQITQLADMIVSSQRREQLLQQVPITVNSFKADFLTTIGAQSLAI